MKKRRDAARHRDRRKAAGRRVRVNEFVDQAGLDEVLRAIDRLPIDLDWALIAPNVVPLLPRRRPMPHAGEPLTVLLPPGIMTGFGVDAGPAVMHVGRETLGAWGVDAAEVAARALGNVRLRSESLRPRDLHRDAVDGIRIRVLQTGEGIASALLLVPDELVRLFGEADQWFIAPMRDLVVSVDGDADPAFVAWLDDELAALDPNALAVEPFVLAGGQLRLAPIERVAAGLEAAMARS
jgi:hypothetical protein